jgi:hypothetical protein
MGKSSRIQYNGVNRCGNETIVPVTFWEIIKFLLGKNSWRPFSSRIP